MAHRSMAVSLRCKKSPAVRGKVNMGQVGRFAIVRQRKSDFRRKEEIGSSERRSSVQPEIKKRAVVDFEQASPRRSIESPGRSIRCGRLAVRPKPSTDPNTDLSP